MLTILNQYRVMLVAVTAHCGHNRGVVAIDLVVDLYLNNLEVHDPLTGPAISIDNSGLDIGVQGGNVPSSKCQHLDKLQWFCNRDFWCRR